jgi:hypothetical protein
MYCDMMITRNNYEEYFMLYADNELSAAEKKAVETFVIQNPDLEKELLMVQQTILKPDNRIVFENKSLLMKQTFADSIININNYEEYFLLYTDNELDKAARKDVELFVNNNPSLKEELNILLQTKLVADTQIIFEGKEILYKKEKDDKVIPLPWLRIAAAAAVLLLLGFFIINSKTKPAASFVKTQNPKTNNAKNNPAIVINKNKKDDSVVTSSTVASLDNTEATIKKGKVKNIKSDNLAINKSIKKEMINPVKKQTNNLPAENNTVEIQRNQIAKVEEVRTPETVEENTKVNTVTNTIISKVDNTVAAATDNKNDEHNYLSQALQTNNNTNSDDVFYVANTSSKKSKLRGIFRKVSRVFDKTANADDDNKHGVLIGSFQIALK